MTHMNSGPAPKPDYSTESTGSTVLAVGYGLLSVACGFAALELHQLIELGYIPHLPEGVDVFAPSLLGIVSVVAGVLAISEYTGIIKLRPGQMLPPIHR